MDNPFKQILHNEELPEVLKDKVLNDVAMIKLSIDIADLFVVKYPSTIVDLLSSSSHNKNESKKD
ncbi:MULTISPECIES: hypothetical protein [Tenacibaculum]|uniref:Uncharacterized protein n=2 Tax=Tenacibaculum TaxID=104267 RepID=A0AAE9SES4_9FLAO|nr:MULTISPECIES: hypothetical protein [Tenacibaculum]GFD76237.1 hypothetical protein KUL113_56570 [Tenacibaculum sp. KUL113]GFD82278.1 hypothetical protein KUL118_51400 [Tenacibaculum sp. KUL118]GFD96507.1 hypothetical protein KUL154_52400 [Alteromonas sp. KUL154]GFE03417.1 hypothetical protein KUL156_60090 [Alteromonas sp. KUL156]AZJ32589.1 hypothetical protein D6200_08505 [Tenacibaculum mesophilum]